MGVKSNAYSIIWENPLQNGHIEGQLDEMIVYIFSFLVYITTFPQLHRL
jgi:hypothetical protein